MADLSPRDEAILTEIVLLRRERIRIDARLRDLTREQNKLPLDGHDPAYEPCVCLRCDYAWFPDNPLRHPKCCSRCGTTRWMEPPTERSRKPGDPPAPSWRRRKSNRGELVKSAREHIARIAHAMPPWRGSNAPMTPPPFVSAVRERVATAIFPPPPPSLPDISRVLPPPPDPAVLSLSARLAGYRPQDESPEQPERIASLTPPPPVTTIVEADDAEGNAADFGAGECDPPEDHGAGDGAAPRDDIRATPIVSVPVEDRPPAPRGAAPPEPEVIPEYVPPESIGVPQSDAEREELEKAKVEAWPTTRPED